MSTASWKTSGHCWTKARLNDKNPFYGRYFLLAFWYLGCESKPYKKGAALYRYYCASCHMEEGQGLRGLFPPIAGSDYLEKHFDQLPCIIKNGMEEKLSSTAEPSTNPCRP